MLADKSLDEDEQNAVHEAPDDLGVAEWSIVEPRERKRSEPVRSACLQCRRRKTKCSGERPVCRSCTSRDVECRWQTPEGLTRTEALKQELQSVINRLIDSEILVGRMQRGSDEESTLLLARLRLGDSVEELAHDVRTRQVHLENCYKQSVPSFRPRAGSG